MNTTHQGHQAPLALLIVIQNTVTIVDEEILTNTTKNLKREIIARVEATSTSLNKGLTTEMTRTLSNGKEASNWLNVLLLAKEGYVLDKKELRDAMVMRYNNQILRLPSKCACGSNFDPVML